jgi:3'-phosphoadenosine 5'-phosphosulfate sulfotransferase (PAPS reductase)/FAD synthetase
VTKYYALYSGGKDSGVLVDYLLKRDELQSAVFFDTGVSAPDLLPFIKSRPFPVEIYQTPQDFEELVQKVGFARPDSHFIYVNELKGRGLRAFKRTHKKDPVKPILASGVRKLESARRTINTKRVSEWEGFQVHAPLFDWTTERVWAYVRENHIEVSPCYQIMHFSGDCFCGAFTQRGEKMTLKTFYPELYKRITALEQKVGGVWGSRTLPRKHNKLDSILCSECQIG